MFYNKYIIIHIKKEIRIEIRWIFVKIEGNWKENKIFTISKNLRKNENIRDNEYVE